MIAKIQFGQVKTKRACLVNQARNPAMSRTARVLREQSPLDVLQILDKIVHIAIAMAELLPDLDKAVAVEFRRRVSGSRGSAGTPRRTCRMGKFADELFAFRIVKGHDPAVMHLRGDKAEFRCDEWMAIAIATHPARETQKRVFATDRRILAG